MANFQDQVAKKDELLPVLGRLLRFMYLLDAALLGIRYLVLDFQTMASFQSVDD